MIQNNHHRKFTIAKQAFFLFFAFFVQAGCKKFVEIAPPSSEIVTVSVFSDNNAATSAMTSIYAQMAAPQGQDSWDMSQKSGLLSDEFTNPNSTFLLYYQNTLSPILPNGFGNWSKYYNYIYQANAILEGLRGSKSLVPQIKKQLTGEAEFLRAFWYFYLVNCYGDVPLVTTTDYTGNSRLSRSPKAQIYDQIIADLKDAKILLSSEFVDGTDSVITTERVRPTKAAASALLARTYLYTARYDSAILEANNVISNPLFSLTPDLNAVFLANSTEAIWQWAVPQPAIYGNQTMDGNNFILIKAPGATDVWINTPLLNSFETGDNRRISWVSSFVSGSDTLYFPFKYQVHDINANPNNRSEYTMVLRLAEQYLIRSEAEAHTGDSVSAINDLNVIRNRAGLTNYAESANGPLLTAILHERQVEFFTEWGHRWFDLIRTGNIDAVMGGPGNICQLKGGTWAPYKALYPIYQTDIKNDPNLVQNPGY